MHGFGTDLLDALWIHPRYILAGMIGAVVATLRDRESQPKEVIRIVLLGALCANYMTVALIQFFRTPEETSAFFSGFAARPLLHQWIKQSRTIK